jgi:hypothetical protein
MKLKIKAAVLTLLLLLLGWIVMLLGEVLNYYITQYPAIASLISGVIGIILVAGVLYYIIYELLKSEKE